MEYPKKATVELGLRMVSVNVREIPSVEQVLEESRAVEEAFRPVPAFESICASMHRVLHHSPIAYDCHMQKEVLFGIMAKMFISGWNAGRQELIDAELAKMETTSGPDSKAP